MNCETSHTYEWVALNFNQILTSRQTTFKATKNHRKIIGLNAFDNRVFILNDRIPLNRFNLNFDTFKVKCKNEILKS